MPNVTAVRMISNVWYCVTVAGATPADAVAVFTVDASWGGGARATASFGWNCEPSDFPVLTGEEGIIRSMGFIILVP